MKKEKREFKLLTKFKNLSKKKKIIVIASIVLLFIGAGVGTYFLVRKKTKPVVKEEIVIEKDNFIYKNGNLIFLDPSGDEIGEYKCKLADADKCYVAFYDLDDVDLNITKYKYEDNSDVLIRSVIYNHRYVFVQDDEDIIFYDIEEKKDIETLQSIRKASDDTVIIKNEEELYGAYEFDNDSYVEHIKPVYNDLNYFKDKYIFKEDDMYGVFGYGEILTKSNIPNKIVDLNMDLLILKVGDVHVISNYEGEQDDHIYDYVKLEDDLLFLINNNKLTIRDYNFNKVNEERINLSNKFYNHEYIFDKKSYKKLKEEKAFEYITEQMNLKVVVGNKEYNYNLFETALNAQYSFVNYINGKLYIYKDEAKDMLLHAYTCNNKNDVTKSSKAFENCFIAKEKILLNRALTGASNGFVPIYNERYVFINDSKPLALTQNILLLDMNTEKTVGPYNNIDAGFHDTSGIFMVEPENVLIMAENTNKKFGLFKINKSGLTSVLTFKYNSIKYLVNDILAYDGSEYVLHKETGEKITSSSNEIVSYMNDYVVIKTSGNQYRVDSIAGTVISQPFKYVILGKNYFAGLKDNNEIEIYKYTDPSNNILSVNPKIHLTNDIKNSFNFVDNNNLSITLYKSDGTFETKQYNSFGVEL